MSSASILYCFDHSLTEYARAFVHGVVKILEDTRGIRLNERDIEDGIPSQTFLYLTQEPSISLPGPNCSIVTDIDTFFTHLSKELDASCRPADASTLRYVVDLCRTETERGGLGFLETRGIDWSLSQVQLQGLRDLLEAWLESLNSAESGRCLPAPLSVKASTTRPMTLAEKILAHHAFSLPSADGLKTGDFVRASIDWIIASELSWVVGQFLSPSQLRSLLERSLCILETHAVYLSTLQGMKHSMISIGEEPTVWRNDRFWLAGDHTVDPRTYHQPRVRELIDGMKDAKTKFKMTQNQGANVSSS